MIKVFKKIPILFLIFSMFFCFVCGFVFMAATAEEQKPESIIISVDLGNYEQEDLPYGLEGASYPVFNCRATDNFGKEIEDVETYVFFDKNSDTHSGNTVDDIFVPINEGRFKTESVGQYVIEYTGEYEALRKTIRLYVNVIDDSEYVESSYEISESIVDETMTGIKVMLPEGNAITDSRFGDISVSTEITYLGDYLTDNESIKIIDSYGGDDYFIPTVAGEYKITYKLQNILGQDKEIEENIDILVKDSTTPIIDVPVVNKVLHVGKKTIFPLAEAIQYNKGESLYVPVNVYFNDIDITESRTIVPDVSSKATVSYVAKSLLNPEEKSVYTVDVVVNDLSKEIDDIYLSNYFYYDNFVGHYAKKGELINETDEQSTATYLKDAYVLRCDDINKDSAHLFFGRAVHQDFLQIEFSVQQKKSNFKNLYVNLIDSADAEKKIQIKLTENIVSDTLRYVDVYVNDIFSKSLRLKCFSPFDNVSYDSGFVLIYNDASKTIIDDKDNLICDLKSWTNGDQFDGFTNCKAYITMAIDGITGESEISIDSIATQVISDTPRDRTKPNYIDSNRGIIISDINTVATIKYPEVFDVLDDALKVKLKIISPSRVTVYDEFIIDNIDFIPKEYGNYDLIYTVYDSANNSREKKTTLTVVDRIAPEINVPNVVSSVKVGETYTFPIFSATDNSGKECNTWISISYGDFRNEMVEKGKYTFKQSGTYIVKYNAIDEDGNYCIVSYTVVCK